MVSKSSPQSCSVVGTRIAGEAHLNTRLYERLRAQILCGHLSPGAKMPSTRSLAVSLGLSRNTVIKAFDQLNAEGYIRGRSGSGTFVAEELPDDLIQSVKFKVSDEIAARPLNPRRGIDSAQTSYRTPLGFTRMRPIRPFVPGVPALDAFPYAVWTRLLKRQWKRRRSAMLNYADPAGFPALRKAICAYLNISRGVQCQPEQIVVVAGTQQALHLVSHAVLQPGDAVWIEEPGYFAAQAAFEAASAKIVPIAVDCDGLDVRAGIAANAKARAVYTTPGHQFPLGSSMSVARRLELLRWASKSGAWVLEDDYDGEFHYSTRPLPALQSLDRNGNVIYVGSFSKVLFPALRLGYMVVPPSLLTRITTAKFLTDWHCSTIDQALVAQFMSDGHFLRHIRKMRALYLERLEALLASAHSELKGAVEICRPNGGMHVIASLPTGVDDRVISAAIDKMGVSSLPLSLCCVGRNRSPALLLGFAAYTPQQIRKGCRLLAAALDSLLKH